MITVTVTEIEPRTRSYRVQHTDSGMQHIELKITVGDGQSWSKEFPKIMAAIMALTGVHDPELIDIVERTPVFG
ncbi:MAG: hypothetical protein ACREGB_04765 [Candidatus Saccharimonadales bacterium]